MKTNAKIYWALVLIVALTIGLTVPAKAAITFDKIQVTVDKVKDGNSAVNVYYCTTKTDKRVSAKVTVSVELDKGAIDPRDTVMPELPVGQSWLNNFTFPIKELPSQTISGTVKVTLYTKADGENYTEQDSFTKDVKFETE